MLVAATAPPPPPQPQVCTSYGDILVAGPDGKAQCIAGYDAFPTSGNCPSPSVITEVRTGRATCYRGASCPAGYEQGMPAPLAYSPMRGLPGEVLIPQACEAVCTPLMLAQKWPCSCPYSQEIGPDGHCRAICGQGQWAHSPTYKAIWGLPDDPGVCNCGPGQRYDVAKRICAYTSATDHPSSECRAGTHKAGEGCAPNTLPRAMR